MERDCLFDFIHRYEHCFLCYSTDCMSDKLLLWSRKVNLDGIPVFSLPSIPLNLCLSWRIFRSVVVISAYVLPTILGSLGAFFPVFEEGKHSLRNLAMSISNLFIPGKIYQGHKRFSDISRERECSFIRFSALLLFAQNFLIEHWTAATEP